MIITMASFKGGVGKSTSAVHIAAELAKTGKILLVDADPNNEPGFVEKPSSRTAVEMTV